MQAISIQSLIRDTPTPIALVDTKLNFINYSEQWLENITPDLNNIQSKHLFDAIKETPVEFQRAVAKGLEGRESVQRVQKFILPSGTIKWLRWSIKVMRNDENQINGLMIFLEDNSEENRELELLRKAESVARIGGWEVDLLKNTLFWTKTTKEIHEVDEDFIPNLEQGINFYKKGYHREKITELVSTAIEKGKPWDTELIIVTAKGNEIWVRAKGEVEIWNDKVIRLVGTFQDIDERKKIELAHKEITERLKIATQTAHIGIWEYHIKKNELFWDDEMFKVFEVAKNQFSGKFEDWESTLHPEDKEKALAASLAAISGGKDFDEEFRIVLQDGGIKHIRGISKTIKDINGNVIKMTGANWDVTELKRTQLKLERNEESFIKSFENSILGMAMVTIDGKFIKVNKSLIQSFGYTPKEITELTFQELTHPEDLDKDLDLLQQLLDDSLESYQMEKRYFHKNGGIIHVILTATIVKDLEGNPAYVIRQIQDITTKKKAELTIQETAERLKVATSVANIGIWEYHTRDNTVHCNENMYKIYEIPKGSTDLLDAWMKRIHPEDVAKVSEALEKTITHDIPFNIKYRGIKPNGQLIYLVAIGEAQKNKKGRIEKVVGANLDITTLKSTELQLERNIASFTDTFENAAIGMALVSPQHDWLKVNKSLSKILGYSEEELLQSKTLDITHPDDLVKSKDVHEEAYKGKKDTYQLEKRYFHKDGHLVHVILAITVVKDLDGNPMHSIAQILDITNRIESEKKLESLVEVTKSQNDSLMNFAHIVSHNLRSHSTNLNMLTKFLANEEDVKEREHLEIMITNAADSLSETIAHLNDVVQIKTGTLEHLKSVSVLNTIQQIQKSISGLLDEKKARLEIEISKTHFVNAVPAYLESIFLNILTNALKYSAESRDPVIKIKSSLQKDNILLTFTDNGQGIDLNRHGDKIFGMYKTFHKHKDAKGIGLFITKNQIEAMSGTIRIESEVNVGTTIFIELQQG